MAMHPVRRQRLQIAMFIIATASIAAALIFWALGKNMNFFYSPSQVHAGEAPLGKTIRVGGLVLPGTVARDSGGLEVSFLISDTAAQMEVRYLGILPDLFSEGQGVVAVGELEASGGFRASQVLAKHDENYMPPEVHDALLEGESLQQAQQSGDSNDS